MVGRTIGRYRILDKLGEGGMAAVYLAWDDRLERKVALKLLPATPAEDPARLERFRREAKLLAATNHPSIVTAYSVESADGLHFITMEHVDGQDLAGVIREGGLPVRSILDVGIRLAEALAAAHAQGVWHRDLKPTNVMMAATEELKILDFGLARSPHRATATPDSDPTGALDSEESFEGTPPYMAPEQISGASCDHRSDIYSLGAILFELATGERPFRGASLSDLVASILRDRPPLVSELRSGFPARLAWLIDRCLEKDPARRLQSMVDVVTFLHQVREEHDRGIAVVHSIAVLPFVDMSPKRDQDYFCDGIAEELINALTKIEGLRVASRASSFQFRQSGLDVQEIGRALAADFILEGGVRKAGNRLRITVELVKCRDGFNVWSKRYDRELEDIFAIQDEITRATVRALELTISPNALRAMRRESTRDLDAYDFYLRGRKYFSQYRRHGMEFAIAMFSRAIELDADYALAWAGIADCCAYLYANAQRDPALLERALAASAKAIELDSELAEGYVARGVSLSYSERTEEADRSFEAAVRLEPNSFDAEYFFARHCFSQGRPEEAITHYQRAAALRPNDYQGLLLSAQIYDDLGRAEEALVIRKRGVALAQKRLSTSPDDTRALYMAANALVALGQAETSLEMARRARELDPEEPMLLYNLACIYSMAGRPDEALDSLESAFRNGFSFREWPEHDSNLDAIRDRPRFARLLRGEVEGAVEP